MIPRDCCEVIKSMLSKIPVEKSELINDLNWNYEDAKYKAPEETLQWIRTQHTLNKHIIIPIEIWEFEILSIFTTLSIDKLKEMINEQ